MRLTVIAACLLAFLSFVPLAARADVVPPDSGDAPAPSDDGGCSVASVASTGDSALSALGALSAVALLVHRRRRR